MLCDHPEGGAEKGRPKREERYVDIKLTLVVLQQKLTTSLKQLYSN